MEDIMQILNQMEEIKKAEVVQNCQQETALDAVIRHFRNLAEAEKKNIISVNVNVVVTDEDIDDIMCTALEGGINYWCRRAEIDGGYRGECASEQISRGGTLILHDAEENQKYVLTKGSFLAGLERYLKMPSSCRFIEYVSHEPRIDIGYIDALEADCIIQYAIFGDIIYG